MHLLKVTLSFANHSSYQWTLNNVERISEDHQVEVQMWTVARNPVIQITSISFINTQCDHQVSVNGFILHFQTHLHSYSSISSATDDEMFTSENIDEYACCSKDSTSDICGNVYYTLLLLRRVTRK